MNEPFSLLDCLSEEAVFRLDAVCCRFEEALQAGRQPVVEHFLAGADGPERMALLCELRKLERYYRGQAGERLSSHDYKTRVLEAAPILRG